MKSSCNLLSLCVCVCVLQATVVHVDSTGLGVWSLVAIPNVHLQMWQMTNLLFIQMEMSIFSDASHQLFEILIFPGFNI